MASRPLEPPDAPATPAGLRAGWPPRSGRLAVRVYHSFEELPAGYEVLFSHAGRRSFFLTRAWFTTLLEHAIEQDAWLRLYGVEDAETREPLALLIARTPGGQRGSLLRARRFGGRSLASLTDYQTVLFAPLLAPDLDDRRAVLQALMDGIASEQPAWSVVEVDTLDPESPCFEELREAMSGQLGLVSSYPQTGVWHEACQGLDGDGYLSRRPRSVRKGYGRKLRRLEEQGRVDMVIFTSGADIERGISAFEQVWARSWKKPEYAPEFSPALIRRAAAAGVLRLGVLYLDQRPVAVEKVIVNGDEAVLLKGAYAQEFHKFSPGGILLTRVIRYLLDEDRVRCISFGRDDEPYKQLWASQRRELRGLIAFNLRTPAGLASAAEHYLWVWRRQLGDTLRRWRRPASGQASL